jgi:hypothetical protein
VWYFDIIIISGKTALFDPQPSIEDSVSSDPVFTCLDFATIFFLQPCVRPPMFPSDRVAQLCPHASCDSQGYGRLCTSPGMWHHDSEELAATFFRSRRLPLILRQHVATNGLHGLTSQRTVIFTLIDVSKIVLQYEVRMTLSDGPWHFRRIGVRPPWFSRSPKLSSIRLTARGV